MLGNLVVGVHQSLVGAALVLYNKPYPREMITYQRRVRGYKRGKPTKETDLKHIHTKFFPRKYRYAIAMFEYHYDNYNPKLVGMYEARRLASKGLPGLLLASYQTEDTGVRKSIFLIELSATGEYEEMKYDMLNQLAIKLTEPMMLYEIVHYDIYQLLFGEAPRYPHYSKYHKLGKIMIEKHVDYGAALYNTLTSDGIISANNYFVDADKDYGIIVGYTPFNYPLRWFRLKHGFRMRDPKTIAQIKLYYPEISAYERTAINIERFEEALFESIRMG